MTTSPERANALLFLSAVPPARERGTQRDFALAVGCARENQPGDIGRRHEQHERDGAHQQLQRPADRSADFTIEPMHERRRVRVVIRVFPLQAGLHDRELRLRALDLELEVLGVETSERLAGADAIADIDEPADDLSGDAEAEIGFVTRPHDADEVAGCGGVLEADALHLDRALGPGGGRGLRPAGGEQRRCGDREEGAGERTRRGS